MPITAYSADELQQLHTAGATFRPDRRLDDDAAGVSGGWLSAPT
jgi:hypothetical protein